MAMKTNFKKQGDTLIVSMDGKLDVEAHEPLKADLQKLMRQQAQQDASPKKIIFNLENLEFVGSSGISNFIQTLREFNVRAPEKPRYCNVKSEFRRVMQAFDENDSFEFFETEERARKSFDQ